jgi:hypothetical protein
MDLSYSQKAISRNLYGYVTGLNITYIKHWWKTSLKLSHELELFLKPPGSSLEAFLKTGATRKPQLILVFRYPLPYGFAEILAARGDLQPALQSQR